MADYVDQWAAQGKKNIFGSTVKVMEMQSEAGACLLYTSKGKSCNYTGLQSDEKVISCLKIFKFVVKFTK